jgi:hypothetical protein
VLLSWSLSLLWRLLVYADNKTICFFF